MDVNEKVLDAIELLANNSVQKAGYDKTIQAQILSCEDQVIGKYRCKYQDAVFYAYTNNPDIRLSKGTLVYILVPGNDMRQQKTIIGMVDKLGADYISAAVGDQAYNVIGSNVIQGGAAPYDKFYLDIDIANYSYNIYDIDNNIDYIDLNITELNQYIKQASSIIIGMNVKTDIPLEKQKTGSYGIKFTLEFKDEKDHNGIFRDYILDEDRMIDNPYNLIYPTRQYAIFDIDNQNFVKVKKITIFNKDFPGSQGEDHITRLQSGQIELTNFELSCAVRMSQEELNGLGLSIISPRGLIFFNSTDEPKILQAQVKFKGRVVSSQNVQFYWGVEDLRVNPQSEGKYNKYLGRGWNCINEKSTIQPQGGAETIQWLSYGDTYEFKFSQALVRDNRVKVAAVYDGNVITKQINVQNLSSSAGSIVINSPSGTQFYYGIGETLLQCVANVPGHTVTSYAWGWQNNGGELQQFSTTVNTLTVEARYIYNFAIYRCSVYDNDGNCLGTASIRLSNSMQGEGTNPLVIQNGIVLYKYNEKGISPTSRTLQNPQIVQVLRFQLYDDVGQEIQVFHGQESSRLIDSRASVKWRVPADNTLLTLPDQPQNLPIENGYYVIQNTETLTYDLVDRYDPRKTINQIILQVTYDGATSIAQTNLTFTKQGQIGTNGTDYYVNITPNVPDGDTAPLFPMITKFGDTNKCKLNYKIQQEVQSSDEIIEGTPYELLKVQLLHGGDKVTLGQNDSIKWRVLKNHYYGSGADSIDDDTDFIITNDSGATVEMSYTDSLGQLSSTWIPAANIIECEITYDGHTYYSAIPFTTAYMASEALTFDLVDGTGFHYVMYSSEGMQPEYSSLPFKFTDNNIGTCQVMGNIKIKNGDTWDFQDSGDLVQNSQDPFQIQPIGFYKGECVNNAVRYQNNNGIIHIPIHFYLNRYNFAHLNGWDGNSIQINEEDGYILAPQLGAGKKQNDNSFTGVLMGQVKNPMKNQSDVGLFGYASGERSFFVNSKNGSAIFGTSGNGQIIIDPGSDKAMLYSHNFWRNYNSDGLPNSYLESNYADAGMLIDLTTPQIVFKDKNFWIQSDGSIKSNRIPQYENGQIKKDDNGQIIYQNKWGFEINSQTGAINSGYNIDINDYNFKIDNNGNVSFSGDLKVGRISSNKYNFFVDNTAQPEQNPKDTLLQAGWDTTNNKYNFTITADGDVSMAGDIIANSGHIGGSNGWTIGAEQNRGYIYSNRKTTLNNQQYGVYVGTDGISVADVFKVSANGTIKIAAKAITLSKDTPITWGAQNSTDLEEIVEGIVNGDGVPSYIDHTFINGKKILSPLIYGGQFYATGIGSASGAVGDKNPAYYISDGYTGAGADMIPNSPIASLSYDTVTTDSDTNASTRVFLQVFNKNNESHALKLLNDGGNISIESLCIDQGSLVNPPIGNGSLYLKGQKKIHLTGPLVLEKLSDATSSIAEAYRGHYGTQLPDYGSTTYTPHLGRVFFKLK